MSDGILGRRASLANRLRRLPIRVRLTLIFGAAMLFVLAACGLVVFERVRSQVDARLDLDVSRQASALLSQAASSRSGLTERVTHPQGHGRQVDQVLDSHGRVLAASPGVKRVPLLKGRQLQAALHRRLKADRPKNDPLPSSLRLVSTPIRIPGHGSGVLVVGTSLDDRAASLSSLALALVIVGPVALLVATAAGYRLTRATLEPVELMRRRAAQVSPAEPGVRLPLPPADDEIRELGTTLNDMLGRLEESLAREHAFVANASHELRTPLSNLRVELDLALRRPRSPDELIAALRSVQGEVDRLSDLADDLLVMARADDGQLPIRPETLDVRELFDTVRGRFGDQRDRLRVPDGASGLISVDRSRLEQALANMVDNALRYSEGEVTLSGEPAGENGYELHVRDDGPGFPSEFLDQAFERFSRADPGRAGRGAGLGLSIVRMIARAHDGEAHAENRSVGADVWVVIPGSPDG
jgi:two-component system, OmpR family, sensor kinase